MGKWSRTWRKQGYKINNEGFGGEGYIVWVLSMMRFIFHIKVSQKSSTDEKDFGGTLSRSSFGSRHLFPQLLGVLAVDRS